MVDDKKTPTFVEVLQESPVAFVGLSMVTLLGLLWAFDTLTRPEREPGYYAD